MCINIDGYNYPRNCGGMKTGKTVKNPNTVMLSFATSSPCIPSGKKQESLKSMPELTVVRSEWVRLVTAIGSVYQ